MQTASPQFAPVDQPGPGRAMGQELSVLSIHDPTSAVSIKEALINPSFRRMPESRKINSMDSGMRRNDDCGINQSLLSYPTICKRAIVDLVQYAD